MPSAATATARPARCATSAPMAGPTDFEPLDLGRQGKPLLEGGDDQPLGGVVHRLAADHQPVRPNALNDRIGHTELVIEPDDVGRRRDDTAREAQVEQAAAAEVDAHRQSPQRQGDHARQDDQQGEGEEPVALVDDVDHSELLGAEQAGAFGRPDTVQDDVQEGARDGDGREQADAHAQRQRQAEALDDAGAEGAAEPEEDPARDERREVGVTDRRPGTREAGIDRLVDGASGAQLLLHPFEDQDVGVDRHADGQDEARHARQRQGDRDQLEEGEREGGVDQQRQVRQDARQAVVDGHEDHHHGQADDAGHGALAQQVFAQRRADGAALDDLQGDGQRAVAQLDGQAIGAVLVEAAGDHTLALGDGGRDAGGRDQHLVQGDAQDVSNVRGGEVGKRLLAIIGQDKGDFEFIGGRVDRGGGVLQAGARHDRVEHKRRGGRGGRGGRRGTSFRSRQGGFGSGCGLHRR